LEMDVVGSGDSPEAALEDLKGAVDSQVSFAIQMDDLKLIDFPAERIYFKRWDEAQKNAFRRLLSGDKALNVLATVLCLSKEELPPVGRAKSSRRFELMQPEVCAQA
jgi:hypothetical protein